MAFIAKINKKENETLKILEEIAVKFNFKISKGKLHFAGLNLKGGLCILHEKKQLVFDNSMNFENRLEIFKTAFQNETLNTTILNKLELSILNKYFPPSL